MLNGILRIEDFNLGNVKIKNEEEVTIKPGTPAPA